MSLQYINPKEVQVSSCKLGSGAYADVYSGTWKNKEVALKKFRSVRSDDVTCALEEATTMMELQHNNVVSCYGYYFTDDGLPVIVMSKEEKSLSLLFREECLARVPLTTTIIKKRALQVCEAVKYLQMKNISHGDLCMKNIVVDKEGNLKICDFGFAMHLEKGRAYDYKHRCTPSTTAPELYETWIRTFATDMYSVGILLLELVLRNNAYSYTCMDAYETEEGYDFQSFREDVISGFEPTIPSGVPSYYRDLIKSCFVYEGRNGLKRPTIDEMIEKLNQWNETE